MCEKLSGSIKNQTGRYTRSTWIDAIYEELKISKSSEFCLFGKDFALCYLHGIKAKLKVPDLLFWVQKQTGN